MIKPIAPHYLAMIDGLKEVLSVDIERTITLFGKDGDFLNDSTVRTPMPGTLQSVERFCRYLVIDFALPCAKLTCLRDSKSIAFQQSTLHQCVIGDVDTIKLS